MNAADYAASYTLAMTNLRAAYLAAEAGSLAEAVRLAWAAESEAAAMAKALERVRVERKGE